MLFVGIQYQFDFPLTPAQTDGSFALTYRARRSVAIQTHGEVSLTSEKSPEKSRNMPGARQFAGIQVGRPNVEGQQGARMRCWQIPALTEIQVGVAAHLPLGRNAPDIPELHELVVDDDLALHLGRIKIDRADMQTGVAWVQFETIAGRAGQRQRQGEGHRGISLRDLDLLPDRGRNLRELQEFRAGDGDPTPGRGPQIQGEDFAAVGIAATHQPATPGRVGQISFQADAELTADQRARSREVVQLQGRLQRIEMAAEVVRVHLEPKGEVFPPGGGDGRGEGNTQVALEVELFPQLGGEWQPPQSLRGDAEGNPLRRPQTDDDLLGRTRPGDVNQPTPPDGIVQIGAKHRPVGAAAHGQPSGSPPQLEGWLFLSRREKLQAQTVRFDRGAVGQTLAVRTHGNSTREGRPTVADHGFPDFRRKEGKFLQDRTLDPNICCGQGQGDHPPSGMIGGMDFPLTQIRIVDLAVDLEADLGSGQLAG